MIPKMTLKLMAILTVGFLTAQVSGADAPVLNNQNDKVNYAIGVNLVRNFKQQGMEMDLDAVIKGMKDALSGGKLLMTDDDIRKTMSALQNEMRLKQRQTRTAAVGNKREGDAFLADNKKKEGVMTLPNGLQYKILKAGDGKKPTDSDRVEVNYRGTLIDGTEILNTYKGGQAATFKVTETIPGLTEVLKLMPVGSKWQVFVPSQLAYGDKGMGRLIGPNATLIYEVELIGIK